MSFKEKIICLILILVLALIFYVSNQSETKKEISISNNKYTTVGKIFKIVTRRSFTHIYYYYNYNGLRHESWENAKVAEDEVLNKFYLVNLSIENPSYSKIFLEQQITDSIEIANAGFKYK
jgi:nitrogen regulatory protein PII-like uncharacterized protein